MGKSAYSAQEKYELIVAFNDRQTSIQDFCSQYNISDETMKEWIYLYETYGIEGLRKKEEYCQFDQECFRHNSARNSFVDDGVSYKKRGYRHETR
jgi:transposase